MLLNPLSVQNRWTSFVLVNNPHLFAATSKISVHKFNLLKKNVCITTFFLSPTNMLCFLCVSITNILIQINSIFFLFLLIQNKFIYIFTRLNSKKAKQFNFCFTEIIFDSNSIKSSESRIGFKLSTSNSLVVSLRLLEEMFVYTFFWNSETFEELGLFTHPPINFMQLICLPFHNQMYGLM